jgi:tripartite-type tricarboxylate transporter receptor subunit TctC
MFTRLIAVLAVFALVGGAAAQDYPTRPIRIIVPNTAGGPTDVYARLLANQMQPILGQSVVVENRDGAGGQIASRATLAAEPDGHTLLMANTGSAAVTPTLYPNAGYSERDFVAISMVTRVPVLLVVRSDLGPRNVQELLALMRSNPRAVAFGSSGAGQSTHMASALFRLHAGTDTVIVATRGASQAANDIAAGTTQAMFDTSTVLPLVRAGTLRALAVGQRVRSALLPDVPTVQEAGLEGFDITSWYALVARTGTPRPIVERLNATVVEILRRPEIREQLARMNAEAAPSTAEEAQAYIRAESANWAEIVRRTGIRPGG